MGLSGSDHAGSIEALGGEKRKPGTKIRSNSEDRPTLPLNVFGVVPSLPFGPLDSSRRHEKLAASQIDSTQGTQGMSPVRATSGPEPEPLPTFSSVISKV